MTRWGSLLVTALCVSSVSMLLAGCGRGASGTSAQRGGFSRTSQLAASKTLNLTIAVEAPLTGAEAAIGDDILHGAELAARQAPTTEGEQRIRLQIVAADDGGSPAGAVRIARAMVRRHVSAVVGPYDPAADGALPIYKRGQVVVLGLSPAISVAGYDVSLVPSLDQVASVEAQELVEVLHARSVSIVYDSGSEPCTEVGTRMRLLLESSGVSVPSDVALAPGAAASEAIAQLQAARSDAFLLSMPGSMAAEVAGEATDSHVPGRCLVDLVAGGGEGPAGCLAGVLPTVAEMTGGAQYSASYSSNFGSKPGIWGAFAYDSTRLLMAAAEEARSPGYRVLLGALVSVTGIQGVTGDLAISPSDGTRSDPPVLIVDSNATGPTSVDAGWAAYSGYFAPR